MESMRALITNIQTGCSGYRTPREREGRRKGEREGWREIGRKGGIQNIAYNNLNMTNVIRHSSASNGTKCQNIVCRLRLHIDRAAAATEKAPVRIMCLKLVHG